MATSSIPLDASARDSLRGTEEFTMQRRLSLFILATAFLWSSVALADDVTIHIGHNKVAPAEVKVTAGTKVIFHNMDEMPGGHTIVADDGSFESHGLAKDEQWSHTFEKPGAYPYHIKEHPSAKGTIVVE